MSAVDVLAVMDVCARVASQTNPRRAEEVREARAAVAELIEAARNPCIGFIGLSARVAEQKFAALDRLRAAAARCKGEQA